jgi:hypothetical protein
MIRFIPEISSILIHSQPCVAASIIMLALYSGILPERTGLEFVYF